jgi:hypothetical protein
MSVSASFPIRMSPSLKKQLTATAAKLEMSEQQTARLLFKIGIAHLHRIDYDLPAAIVEKSGKRPPRPGRGKTR